MILETINQEVIDKITFWDKRIEFYNQLISMENRKIDESNKAAGFKNKKAKHKIKKSVGKDLERKDNIYQRQQKYNSYLKNSMYNRRVKDYLNGTYESAGQELTYAININNGDMKSLYAFNFNHTLSPLYLNRNAKYDCLKLQRIFEEYLSSNKDDIYYFVTLTTPNIIIKDNNIDEQVKEHNLLMKKANEVINNINKKITKEFGVKGIIKKFECTYKYIRSRNELHPHYHLLVSVENSSYYTKNLMKGENSLRNTIREYWITKFVEKQFVGVSRNKARACYSCKRANPKTIAYELSGYLSKGNDEDYLTNQKTFDHAYQFFHNKRILTYLGLFKEVNKKLNLDKTDNVVEDEEDINPHLERIEREAEKRKKIREEYTHIVSFQYFHGNYKKGYQYSYINEIESLGEKTPNNRDFTPRLDTSTSTCKIDGS